ncbi:hypothetical protein BST61_g6531 [Cercospora zeina]
MAYNASKNRCTLCPEEEKRYSAWVGIGKCTSIIHYVSCVLHAGYRKGFEIPSGSSVRLFVGLTVRILTSSIIASIQDSCLAVLKVNRDTATAWVRLLGEKAHAAQMMTIPLG